MARSICSVTDCTNAVKAYGICATHNDRKKAGWPDWDTRPIQKKRRLNYGKLTHYEPWEYYLFRNYGLKKGEYDSMLDAQGGGCAICGEQCSTGRRLAVDHDHYTGTVRGLLCCECNQGLGKFKDCPDLLIAAAAYIQSRTH